MILVNKNMVFLKYFKLENILLDIDEFNFQLDTHPDYPSLLSYHDALNFFNIKNIAIKINDKDLTNLPNHFIAEVVLNRNNSKLALVENKENEFILFIDTNSNFTVTRKEFQDIWTGVILVAEKEEQEKGNNANIEPS